jgi:hypothetical protein
MRQSVKFKKHGRMSPRNPKKCTDLAPIDAIMRAAEVAGNPSKRGKGGVIGYLSWLAIKEPRAFASLFGRALPPQKTVGPGTGTGAEITLANAREKFADRINSIAQRLIEGGISLDPAELLAPEPSPGSANK